MGLIGYGYAGKTFHAPLIRSVPSLDLVVVGSSRPETVKQDLPAVTVCTAEQVVTHELVDLVVIASPNESHFPLAAAALRAGKDVVVDKPFTVTLSQARELAEVAEGEGRLLSVFHNRRWESEVLATQGMLHSKVLGTITHYECHMDRYRPLVRDRWRERPGPGAGLWFDLGPHLIDLALFFFGLPESVLGTFAIHREGGTTDDWAHVQLIYKDLSVILHASLLVAGGGPRSVLHGSKGSWMKFGGDVQERQLTAGMLPSDPDFGVDADPGILVDGATGNRTHTSVPAGRQQGYYEDIAEAIHQKRAPFISCRDAVAVMAVLETSIASGLRGQALPLPLTSEELSKW